MNANAAKFEALIKKHPLPALAIAGGGVFFARRIIAAHAATGSVGAIPVLGGAPATDPNASPYTQALPVDSGPALGSPPDTSVTDALAAQLANLQAGLSALYATGVAGGSGGLNSQPPAGYAGFTPGPSGYLPGYSPGAQAPTGQLVGGALQHVGSECGSSNAIVKCKGILDCINPVNWVKGVVQCGASVGVAAGAAALTVGSKVGPLVPGPGGTALTALGSLGNALNQPVAQTPVPGYPVAGYGYGTAPLGYGYSTVPYGATPSPYGYTPGINPYAAAPGYTYGAPPVAKAPTPLAPLPAPSAPSSTGLYSLVSAYA